MSVRRTKIAASVVTGIGIAACVALFFLDRRSLLEGYLFGFLLWLGISLGCLTLALLHHLVGGRWARPVWPWLQAGAANVPVFGILVIPVLIGTPYLYGWSTHEVPEHLKLYFNPTFFAVRAVVYVILWTGLTWLVLRTRERTRKLGAAGLLVYILSISFAGVDWIMSLEPHWYSTVFGLLFMITELLTGLSLTLFLMTRAKAQSVHADPQALNDLGNLLLMSVMLWAYLSLAQFLIIWYGNLPEEYEWYVHRTEAPWSFVAMGLAALGFALPFFLLLNKRAKRQRSGLGWIALLVLLGGTMHLAWFVLPSFHHRHGFTLADLIVPLALGGIWFVRWAAVLERNTRPALVTNGAHHD